VPSDDDQPITPDAVTPASMPPARAGDEPAGLGSDLFGGGGLDMGALLEQAAKVQEEMAAAQEHAAETVVEGVAGGGVVKVEVTGAMDFRSVTIDPSAVDPDDVEMLQDLVLAALNDAVSQVEELQQSSLNLGALGGMDLGGMDLGGLLGGGLEPGR